MPKDAFEKTKDPKDEGSEFLTKDEKAEVKAGAKEAPEETAEEEAEEEEGADEEDA